MGKLSKETEEKLNKTLDEVTKDKRKERKEKKNESRKNEKPAKKEDKRQKASEFCVPVPYPGNRSIYRSERQRPQRAGPCPSLHQSGVSSIMFTGLGAVHSRRCAVRLFLFEAAGPPRHPLAEHPRRHYGNLLL